MRRLGLVTLGVVALLVGCQSTYQTKNAETSGFLNDYSMLTPGAEGEASLRYLNPDADFSKYTKILFEYVVVYADEDSKLKDLPKEDMVNLMGYLDMAIRETLQQDYMFVEQPAPDVMRLKVAITEAKGSKVVMDTLSSIMPPAIVVSGIKKVTTGTAAAVGAARAEMEISDSVTGEVLLAGVDERAGSKYTGKFDKFSKWQDVQSAFDYWASQLQVKLAELRDPKM